MRHLFIRSDASTAMGSGHIMRCIALAQAWQEKGGYVTFLSHCQNEALQQRIIKEGLEFVFVERPHPDPADLKQVTERLRNFRNGSGIPWIVLDGYHFTPDYQKALRAENYKLLVVDDMIHLNHYHADILLNQNIHAPKLKYTCDKETIKLLGCDYVMLCREFFRYKKLRRHTERSAKKILVTLGGVDSDNVILKVIKALSFIKDPELEVKIAVGSLNSNINSLKTALSISPCTFHLLFNVSNMPSLLSWADLAISGGGSTCWELAFFGIPFLVIVLAKNQADIAAGLDDAGAAINIGWHSNLKVDSIFKNIFELIRDNEKRNLLSQTSISLVDGRGTERILSEMVKYE